MNKENIDEGKRTIHLTEMRCAMVLNRLKAYLDGNGISYDVLIYEGAWGFTSSEIAYAFRISEEQIARVVVLKAGDQFVLAVLPADYQLDLEKMKYLLGTRMVRWATEEEVAQMFPDCAVGATPPFGNLYGLPTYVDEIILEGREIAFPAGNHHEIVKVSCRDFVRLVIPHAGDMCLRPLRMAVPI